VLNAAGWESTPVGLSDVVFVDKWFPESIFPEDRENCNEASPVPAFNSRSFA
jgi:hypothetical protein